MTEKEYAELGDACDLICSLCDRKHDYAFACDDCPVTDVYNNASIDNEEDPLFDEGNIDDYDGLYHDEDIFGMDEDLPGASDMLGSDL